MRLLPLAALALTLAPAPALAQSAGEDSAVVASKCDHDCLIRTVEAHMKALAARDPAQLKLAKDVRYAENDVLLPVGQGLWRTVTGVDATGLTAADPLTGNAAWFGSTTENGKPAIYAVRVHVNAAGAIDEIEAVVHRKTALPAPFGDVTKMVHDPEFSQVLPPEQRRPRERMLSIAGGYFSTVELNDGQVLTNFTDDCARLENGISTTAPPPGGAGGNAAAIASGCENQFKLGIYKINKRVRRDFFIIDTERGVAVGRGFFDHANEFDHYNLTNGREMKTALKWPNSITLLEAFRIRDGKIARIEAVFTYVPYFMPDPFREGVSKPPHPAPQPKACDAACLTGEATQVMQAYVGNQWRKVNWADKVGYGENSVGIRVGEGVWTTVTAIDPQPLIVADANTGKAVWIGRIEEHGQPAWAAMTIESDGTKVGGIEALVRRKEYGVPYAEPAGAPGFAVLPKAQRTSWLEMEKLVDGFYAALNAHNGKLPPGLGADCKWTVNGQALGACAAPIAGNTLQWIARWRDRKVLAVDEARGLIAVRVFEDIPAAPREFTRPDGSKMPNPAAYPRSLQIVELFRIEGGKIAALNRFSTELPFGMKPHE
ncbi:MAG: hypothetical protein ACXWJC_03515 [Croceibacterium sp.]